MNKLKFLSLLVLFTSLHGHINITSIPTARQTSPVFVNSAKQSLQSLTAKQFALIIGATVGCGLLIKWAYNYFKELTDLQEIEVALSLCEKATVLQNEIAFTYQKEALIVAPVKDVSIGNKYTTGTNILSLLRPEILAKNCNRPYYDYIKVLDRKMDNLKTTSQELAKKKIQLFERKFKLHNGKNKKLTPQEIIELTAFYESTITKVESVINDNQNLRSMLLEIHTHVVNSAEYQHEFALARIEELEREIEQLKWDRWTYAHSAHSSCCSHDTYSTWNQPVQPSVTQVHIHNHDSVYVQDHPDHCCSSHNDQYVTNSSITESNSTQLNSSDHTNQETNQEIPQSTAQQDQDKLQQDNCQSPEPQEQWHSGLGDYI
jgi:hypothetical protein